MLTLDRSSRLAADQIELYAKLVSNQSECVLQVVGEVADEQGHALMGADPSSSEFDLVVDASGLHSKLRRHRVEDPVGAHYEGLVLIHDHEIMHEGCPPRGGSTKYVIRTDIMFEGSSTMRGGNL